MNFCPLFSHSEAPASSQRLRNIRKRCLHRFPAETLSVRGVCVMAFSSLVLQVTLSGAKRGKKNKWGRDRKRGQGGDKGNRNMNSRLLALSCLHAGFSVQCLSTGLCYWSVDLTEGKNTQNRFKKWSHITLLFDFCCFVVLVETVHQFRSQQLQFFFSLWLHILRTYTHTHTDTHEMYNFFFSSILPTSLHPHPLPHRDSSTRIIAVCNSAHLRGNNYHHKKSNY